MSEHDKTKREIQEHEIKRAIQILRDEGHGISAEAVEDALLPKQVDLTDEDIALIASAERIASSGNGTLSHAEGRALLKSRDYEREHYEKVKLLRAEDARRHDDQVRNLYARFDELVNLFNDSRVLTPKEVISHVKALDKLWREVVGVIKDSGFHPTKDNPTPSGATIGDVTQTLREIVAKAKQLPSMLDDRNAWHTHFWMTINKLGIVLDENYIAGEEPAAVADRMIAKAEQYRLQTNELEAEINSHLEMRSRALHQSEQQLDSLTRALGLSSRASFDDVLQNVGQLVSAHAALSVAPTTKNTQVMDLHQALGRIHPEVERLRQVVERQGMTITNMNVTNRELQKELELIRADHSQEIDQIVTDYKEQLQRASDVHKREDSRVKEIQMLQAALKRKKAECAAHQRVANRLRSEQGTAHGDMKRHLIAALGLEYEADPTRDIWATAIGHVQRVVQDRQTWNQHRDTYVEEIERLRRHPSQHRDDFNDLLRLAGLKTSDGIAYGRALGILQREVQELVKARTAFVEHMKECGDTTPYGQGFTHAQKTMQAQAMCPQGCGDERRLVCVNPSCDEDKELIRLANDHLATAMRAAGVVLPPVNHSVHIETGTLAESDAKDERWRDGYVTFGFDPATLGTQGLIAEFRTREDGSVIPNDHFHDLWKERESEGRFQGWVQTFLPWWHDLRGNHEQRVPEGNLSKADLGYQVGPYYAGAGVRVQACTDGSRLIVSDKEGDTVRVERYANYVDGAISVSSLDDDGDVRCTFPIHMAEQVGHAILEVGKEK